MFGVSSIPDCAGKAQGTFFSVREEDPAFPWGAGQGPGLGCAELGGSEGRGNQLRAAPGLEPGCSCRDTGGIFLFSCCPQSWAGTPGLHIPGEEITDKFGLEGTFKGHLVQPPCKERGTPAEIPRGRNAPWNL